MKTLSHTRPKEEQNRPYDEKYEIKRNMSREDASTKIQKEYRKIKKDEQDVKTNDKMFANVNTFLEQLTKEIQHRPEDPENHKIQLEDQEKRINLV